MSVKKAGDTPLLSRFAQDNVVILHSLCGGGQNLTVLDGEVEGEKDRQDAKAQFRVHIRRPAVVALQNVHNSDWWLAVYKKKTIGSGRGGPYCEFKIKEIEGRVVSLESVKYKGYYLGVKPDGSGADTHSLFIPYLVPPPPPPHAIIVSHQQNSPQQCYPQAGYPQPGYPTPHSQQPGTLPWPHHDYPQPYPQGYPPRHLPPPQQHRQSYPQYHAAPGPPPQTHPQGYQPHHPAPGFPPQTHPQGYQPHHPVPPPPQQRRQSYPQHLAAPGPPPQTHPQGYQPRHPAPGFPPQTHPQGYQPRHPAPGPPPQPHPQSYQPRKAAPSAKYENQQPNPSIPQQPCPPRYGYQKPSAPSFPPRPRHPAPQQPYPASSQQPVLISSQPPHSSAPTLVSPSQQAPVQPHPGYPLPAITTLPTTSPSLQPLTIISPSHTQATSPTSCGHPDMKHGITPTTLPVFLPTTSSSPQLPTSLSPPHTQPQDQGVTTPTNTTLPTTQHGVTPTEPPAVSSLPTTSPPTTISLPPTQPQDQEVTTPLPTTRHGVTPTEPPVVSSLPTTSPPTTISLPPTQPQDQEVSTPLPSTQHGITPTEPPAVSSLPTTSSPTTISLPPTQPQDQEVSTTLPSTQHGITPTEPPAVSSLPTTSPPTTISLPPTQPQDQEVSTTLPSTQHGITPTEPPAVSSLPTTSPPTTISLPPTQPQDQEVSTTLPSTQHGITPTEPPAVSSLPTTSPPTTISLPPTQPQDQEVTTTLPSTQHGITPTQSPVATSLSTTRPSPKRPTTISPSHTQPQEAVSPISTAHPDTQHGVTPLQSHQLVDVTSPSTTNPPPQPSPSTKSTHSPLPESFIKSLKEQLTYPLTVDSKSTSGASAKSQGLGEELQKETWYHKGASKESAEELLNKSANGSFLVRDGESAAEVCSLSLKYPGGVKHFRILKTSSGLYRVLGSRGFQTILELIDYFTQHSISVDPHHKLRFPCPRPSKNDDDVDAPNSATKLRGRAHTLPEPTRLPAEDQPTAAPMGYDILNLFQTGNILRLIPRADPSALPIYVASKKLHGKGKYHSADSEFLVTVPSHGLVMLSSMQWSNNYLFINRNGKIKADGKEKDDACCFYLFATEDGNSILLESQKFSGWYLAVGIGGEVADPKTLGPGSREAHFAVRAEKIVTPHFHVLTTPFQGSYSVANKLTDRCTIQLFCKQVGAYLSISSNKKAVVEGCRDQDDQHTFFVIHDRGMGIFSLYSYKNPSHMIRMHNNILEGKGDANRSADFYLKETPDGAVYFESFTCPGMHISVSNSAQIKGHHFSVSLLTVKHSRKVETITKTPLSGY